MSTKERNENESHASGKTVKEHAVVAGGDRAAVTVIGLGPMGQALAGAFLNSGHRTIVWNRTPGKAVELVKQGAVLADTAADAVAASSLTIICVLDYNAVNAILSPLGDQLAGRTLVNLTADTPDRSRRMAAWAAEQEIDYIDGAIMTPTPTIGTQHAVVLYSGPEPVYQAHRETLSSIGGTASYLGEDSGRAAAYDVALLDLFWTTMSGYAHALALAGAENVAPKEFAAYARGIAAIMPNIMVDIANAVEAGRHPGDASSITSAAAGMEHIIHAAQYHGMDTSVMSAALAAARRAIDAGYGNDGYGRLTGFLRNPHL